MNKQSTVETKRVTEFPESEKKVTETRFSLRKCCSTRTGFLVALVLWIIFSGLYISIDQFARFRNALVMQAYQSARQDLLSGFIAEATKKSCDTVNVGDGKNSVTVINVACLAPAASSTNKGL